MLPVEIELVKSLCDYPNIVAAAGASFAPSIIANYTYELAKQFNGYYHDYSILREENSAICAMRIRLAENIAKVIKSAMKLLGIEVPDRM